MLDATNAAGIELTESITAVLPTAAVSGYYIARIPIPLFPVPGRSPKIRVEDYAERKGMDVATVERWLAPVLRPRTLASTSPP